MGIIDLFSKRKKRQQGIVTDVFVSGPLPDNLKIQIVHIWVDTIGDYRIARDFYDSLRRTLLKEYGLVTLTNGFAGLKSNFHDLVTWFESAQDDDALNLIELSFYWIEQNCNEQYKRNRGLNMTGQQAIRELNGRFLEHGLGYEFNQGQIVQFTSQAAHTEIIQQALFLLNDPCYRGPDQEFRTAFEHYKKGRAKEAISAAANSFESLMKAICDKRGWGYDKDNESAGKLLKILRDNQLFEKELFGPLSNGLPTIRNQYAGHGAGANPKHVGLEIAEYALHLAASNMVMLVKAEKNLV